MMNKTQKTVMMTGALAIVALLLAATTYAALSTTENLSSTGTVTISPDLAVYSNAACTTPLTTINWGSLQAGGTATQTIYIKNTGSGSSLTLSASTSNWTPTSAGNYITITFQPTSVTIAPGASTAATLTLTVSPSVVDITNFNVQISIIGTTP